MRFAISSGFALTLLSLPIAAHAQSDTPAFTVSGGATIISDYRFRGISLTGKDPAVQATINLSHESGIYVGTWASSIDMGERYGATEVDLYTGWAGSLAPHTSVDVAVAYYSYPGGEGSGKIEYFETTAKLTQDLGPMQATLGSGYSWDQAALGGDHLYLYGEAAVPIPRTPLTLRAHGGRSKGAISPRPGGYYDWSLGADANLGPVTLGLSYIDTDLGRGARADGAALFWVSAAF
ncbi:TorF family putative porin [Novosphingobium aerophilum]|uniref:TorF family putative porin n=1 Tax=Novosphingobium TaxID=165696 RepID=UPI00163D9847|nr:MULTISPECIES: TorF family putative porin [unclassified Novosphingobium]WRT95549.1 TorF family putative porin [Novosphingobium sp. RL4]